ncbi:MAG: hypothetical protein DVB31_06245 [Verrucomicrobia bacterium]|nr:MAG: hypothetical protein DVB31_06245 [Verrucomicrobiota bacterium]
MNATIHTHPGAAWHRAKLKLLAAMLAAFCRFGVRIRALAVEACAMSAPKPAIKTPASVTAETGEHSGTPDEEGERHARSNAQGATPGNNAAGRAPAIHPTPWVPTVNLALAAEILRLEGAARDAEAAGESRPAARCRLLAASLTHTAARLSETKTRDPEAVRASLAEDIEGVRWQIRDAMRGTDSPAIASGYQLDACALQFGLALLEDKGGGRE